MRAFIESRPALFGRPVGGAVTYHCRCPLDKHSKQKDSNPYLSVYAWGGAAFFTCHSCGASGDAIKLARLCLGLDFRSACAEVARCAGANLREVPLDALISKRPRASDAPRAEEPMPLEFLAPEIAAALGRLSGRRQPAGCVKDVAAQLGLPADIIRRHLEAGNPLGGVIGFTPSLNPGRSPRVIRPAFLYFARDGAGKPALIAAKVRYGDEEDRRDVARFVMLEERKGSPAIRYVPPKDYRFNFLAGRACRPWGWEALTPATRAVVITEGESDKLAMETILDAARKLSPAVVVLALSGASGHRSLDPAALRSCRVVYMADRDDAGEKGSEKTLAFLKAHGVADLRVWTPPDGHKDLRACLLAVGVQGAPELLDDILRNLSPRA